MLEKALSVLACIGSSLICHAAILNVTSMEDSGPGTLRDALLVAENHDKIVFNSNLDGIIHLQSALPSLNKGITIQGPVNCDIAINSGGSFDIFDVDNHIAIENLALNLGEVSSHKSIAIRPQQSLTLKNVTINHCLQRDESAIEIYSEGELMAQNLQFSSPSAQGTDISFQNMGSAKLSYDRDVVSWLRVGGSGVLFKNGPGILHLAASESSIQVLFYVNEGTMNFSGTTKRRIVIGAEAVVHAGNYDTLVNSGIFQPSQNPSVAALTKLTGDFVQAFTGNAILQIFPDGSGDQIHLGGTATIYGTLTIHATDGNYLPGTQYTLFTAEGGIDGQFANVSLPENIHAIVDYLPDTVILTITR